MGGRCSCDRDSDCVRGRGVGDVGGVVGVAVVESCMFWRAMKGGGGDAKGDEMAVGPAAVEAGVLDGGGGPP
jgi:hypothetical protein